MPVVMGLLKAVRSRPDRSRFESMQDCYDTISSRCSRRPQHTG